MTKDKEAERIKRIHMRDHLPTNKQPSTYSEVRTWQECSMKHFWCYKAGNGVGVVPVLKPIPFIEGEFLHYALGLWAKTGRMYKEFMQRRAQKKIDEASTYRQVSPDDVTSLETKMYAMLGAALAYKTHYHSDLKNHKFIGIEEEVELTIGGLPFICKLDAISEKEGELTLWERKSAATVDRDKYMALPLDLQGLIYAEACNTKYGKYPAWIQFDYVLKSKLRRRGGTKTQPSKELLEIYRERVTQQYLQEPEKMFFRPPPIRFNQKIHAAVLKDVQRQITMMNGTAPVHNYNSCLGKYGRACEFLPACTALLAGKKDGWNTGECKGMYVPKEVLHPEYAEGITDKDLDANCEDTEVKVEEGDKNAKEKD